MEPPELPLSAEPTLGWRTWVLRRDEGSLTLVSVMRPTRWPQQKAMRSECPSCGSSGPGAACSCGIYASSSPKNLGASGAFTAETSVVGAIAMWGRVIEHDRGTRARFAYPARLCLVCATCLQMGGGGVAPTVVSEDLAGGLVAYCGRHSLNRVGELHEAKTVQSELLSAYAVDLLPRERVIDSLKIPGVRAQLTLTPVLELAMMGLGLVINGFMFFMVMAWWLGVAFAIVGAVMKLITP